MGKVLAVTNQKGGVGKTTTSVNLGTALSKKGCKVLIVDCDPQGNIAACFGIQGISSGLSLASVLNKIILGEAVSENAIIHYQEENIDLLLSDISLAGTETTMINVSVDREYILRDYVDNIKEKYDYILLDCMPSLGMLTINALAAADSVIIPVQAQYLSAKGLEQLIATIGRIRKRINANLEVCGILMTMVDGRTNYARDISDSIKRVYGEKFRIFESVIPRSVKAEECSAAAESIHLHDPRGKVAQAYRALAGEVEK